jgi:PhzF family phenazine biosynthesis protein
VTALPAVLIEAFTEVACAGNGAAVVRLDAPRPAAWMQAVAGSLRQSETAFLLASGEEWLLRWFTPACEVPLCGHATLAALLALGHWQLLPAAGRTRFHTRSGALPVAREPGAPMRGSIELPAGRLRPRPAGAALEELLRARLDCTALAGWSSDLGYTVVLLPPEAPLGRIGSLAAAVPEECRSGLVLMQALGAAGADATDRPRVAGQPADYRLRFFAPGLGIGEDPVTGSAHALVAPWWMERLGRRRVVGWQCSDRPGGMVCEAGSSGMIRLSGCGSLLWDGTLRAPSLTGVEPSGGGSAMPGNDWRQWLAMETGASAFAPA